MTIFFTDAWKSAKRHAVGAKGSASNWTRVDVLHPWTEYEFRISASNSVGTSGWSSPTLKVSTDQEAPEGPPTDISVKANSSQSLDISWKVQLKSNQFTCLKNFEIEKSTSCPRKCWYSKRHPLTRNWFYILLSKR